MKINGKFIRRILKEKKTTSDILVEFAKAGVTISGRKWRTIVRQYNEEFGSRDRYIASDNKGYYLTTSKKAIAQTTANKFKCGLSMMKNAKKDFARLSKKDQLSIFKEEPDIYDMLMKLE